jgi:hypothetical protein
MLVYKWAITFFSYQMALCYMTCPAFVCACAICFFQTYAIIILCQIQWWPRSFASQTLPQCWGSVTFWCGSGSPDPYLWLMDPDPDPTPFFSGFSGSVSGSLTLLYPHLFAHAHRCVFPLLRYRPWWAGAGATGTGPAFVCECAWCFLRMKSFSLCSDTVMGWSWCYGD